MGIHFVGTRGLDAILMEVAASLCWHTSFNGEPQA